MKNLEILVDQFLKVDSSSDNVTIYNNVIANVHAIITEIHNVESHFSKEEIKLVR